MDGDLMVISIDGVCKDEGKLSAVVLYAVYYGKGLRNNNADYIYSHML